MESLLLINPRRKSSKRRRATVRRRRASNPRRSRARRRHHVRGHVARKRSGRSYRVAGHMSNPRRSRRVRRRRHMFGNPRFNVRGIVRETLVPAGIGAGGAILTDIAYAYAQPYLPASLQSGMLPVLAKLGVALAVGLVAGKVAGRRIGAAVTLGGVTVVGYGAIKGTLATALPTVKGLSGFQDFVDYSVTGAGGRGNMGAYMQPRLGFYSPAAVVGGGAQPGMGAYMQPAAAAPPALHGFEGLNASGYDWRNDGM